MKPFLIELLDVPYFSGGRIDAMVTRIIANAIRRQRRAGSARSYDPVLSLIGQLKDERTTTEQISRIFSTHKDQVWAGHLTDVGRGLHAGLQNHKFDWHPTGRKPLFFQGLNVKPAIRGTMVRDDEVMPVLVNARSGLVMTWYVRQFLARGVFEFHGRDIPDVERIAIWDVSRSDEKNGRQFSETIYDQQQMMSIDEFEQIVAAFLECVAFAGFEHAVRQPSDIADLFRHP